MTFDDVLREKFPGSMPEAEFVTRTHALITPYGFTTHNSIACVGLCRDEITLPFAIAVKKTWGEAFNFSSLAGMLFLGKTGFSAAEHHAPREDGKERYIFYCFPHIAIDATGAIGRCERTGRTGPSTACGALYALQKEMESGKLRLGLDFDDVEQSLLKMRLLEQIRYGTTPDLLELTLATLKVVQGDIERMVSLTVDIRKNDYVVFTGIQIHGPHTNYAWPASGYALIDGQRKEIAL